MIDNTFIKRNLTTSVRRYRLLLAGLAITTAVFLAISAVVGSAAAHTAAKLTQQSAISAIKVASASPGGNTLELTADRLASISAMPQVKSVDPWEQEGLFAEESSMWPDASTPLVLWATPRIPYVQPAIDSNPAAEENLGDDEVIIPDRSGDKDMRSLVGTTHAFSYTVATGAASGVSQPLDLKVVGTFDNSVPDADGPTPAYVSQGLMKKLIAARSGLPEKSGPPAGYSYPLAYVQADSPSSVAALQARLSSDGYTASSISTEVGELPGLVNLLSILDNVIAAFLAVFCLASGVAIASAWLGQRRREVGLLRALGWRRQRVLRAFLIEVIGAGLAASLSGAVLGVIISIATSLLLSGRDALGLHFAEAISLPALPWLFGVIGGIPLALALGAVGPTLSLARISPDDALRQL